MVNLSQQNLVQDNLISLTKFNQMKKKLGLKVGLKYKLHIFTVRLSLGSPHPPPQFSLLELFRIRLSKKLVQENDSRKK